MQYKNLTFNDQTIRTVFNEEDNEWNFSIVDVVKVLLDYDNLAASKYWSKLKKKIEEDSTFHKYSPTFAKFRMESNDGKMRLTDVANRQQLHLLINYIPSKKKEEFNTWLDTNFPIVEITESQNSAYLPQKSSIRNLIYTIDNVQFMLDSDLAELFQVDTGNLNKAMKRNIKKFPENFCFQLTCENMAILNFQIGISSLHGGTRKLPYAYTEHGILMLATVLHSDIAVEMSVQIINEFVNMRHFLTDNYGTHERIDYLEKKVIKHEEKFDEIFNYIHEHTPTKTKFFKGGSYFDALICLVDNIESATKEIILIDNYVNLHTLNILAKKKKDVSLIVITHPKTSLTQDDIDTFNKEYGKLTLLHTESLHDRYLILDKKEYFTIGQSAKDLGKKGSGIVEITDSLFINLLISEVNRIISKNT